MRRFAIKSCTWSVSCPVLLSKMGAMRHQKLVGIEVEPLYCKVYDPLPHGTSRLSRFRFGQSVPTPFLCGLWLQRSRSAVARSGSEKGLVKINFSNSERVLVQNQFRWLDSFTEMRPELIPIIAFVPFHCCRVLLKIQPSRQNRHSR